ncbi:AAA family ATPase [Paeniglutamicibacter sp. MACA_103]|uniref:AAA family ATPase n=1 Tax=Paeniglutamicibacter sp. MACA_103 TaxID=3377337 RepID=UPI003896171C
MDPVAAKILFNFGPAISQLKNDVWDQTRPDIRVFDAIFVRDNVYSGAAVESLHRRNLLNFALGDAAVAELKREELATQELKDSRDNVRDTEVALAPHHSGITLNQFREISQSVNVESEIQSAQLALKASRNNTAIQARLGPSNLSIPTWEPSEVLNALASGLPTLHAEAESLVREKVEEAHGHGFESWLREGTKFEQRDKCPYCNQTITGLDLIDAYRQYFDDSYQKHLENLETAISEYEFVFAQPLLPALSAELAIQQARIDAWNELNFDDKVTFDAEILQVHVEFIEKNIGLLIQAKRNNPLAPVTSIVIREAVLSTWKLIMDGIKATNSRLSKISEQIDAYKATLEVRSESSLLEEIVHLNRAKNRWEPAVVDLFVRLSDAKAATDKAEEEQEAARANLRKIMNETLSIYQVAINEILVRFGADFSIVAMKPNFRGSSPQSEYAIELRSKQVPLKNDMGPDFDSALSEGDKRTLAFAFFVASLLRDSLRGDRIVVVDDPMSSMDNGRRFQTAEILLEISRQVRQLILTGHDPVFLRMFRDRIKRDDKSSSVSELGLTYGSNGYSRWEQVSLDRLCETDYLTKHREVSEHLRSGSHDATVIGSHLRPLLEGYLHRRFPTEIPEGHLLGEAITRIRASNSVPLIYAHSVVDEIEALNTFAGNFHHSTNSGYAMPLPSPTEIRQHAQRTLDVIHGKP